MEAHVVGNRSSAESIIGCFDANGDSDSIIEENDKSAALDEEEFLSSDLSTTGKTWGVEFGGGNPHQFAIFWS